MALSTSMQGIHLPSPCVGPGDLKATIQLAEWAGFYSHSVVDFMTPI